LGAQHDDDIPITTRTCDGKFIMSAKRPRFYVHKKYIASHWHFSQCSVDSMKARLQG
ncbi:hypothetical protein ACJMK2_007669, partial [Sinanodonta woodiana]